MNKRKFLEKKQKLENVGYRLAIGSKSQIKIQNKYFP